MPKNKTKLKQFHFYTCRGNVEGLSGKVKVDCKCQVLEDNAFCTRIKVEENGYKRTFWKPYTLKFIHIMNKTKLKTYGDMLSSVYSKRIGARQPQIYTPDFHAVIWSLDAHHSYLLELESRIAELEKKLNKQHKP